MRTLVTVILFALAACSAPSSSGLDCGGTIAHAATPTEITILQDMAQGLVNPPATLPRRNLRIMGMGDSNSADGASGQQCPGTYRVNLWKRFTDASVPVSFVGTNFSDTAHSSGVSYILGDRMHEAIAAATISTIGTYGVPSVTLLKPDVVLIWAGANDLFGGAAVATTAAALDTLVGQVQAAMGADGWVYVANLPPILNNPSYDANYVLFNAAIVPLMAARHRVTLVDLRTPLAGGGALYFDNYHLSCPTSTTGGYPLVSAAFWNAMIANQ